MKMITQTDRFALSSSAGHLMVLPKYVLSQTLAFATIPIGDIRQSGFPWGHLTAEAATQ